MAIETIDFIVGLCQFSSIPGDVEANLKRIEECCIKATSGAADLEVDKEETRNKKPALLVFPELATVGYFASVHEHRELAETITGTTSEKLQQLAIRYRVGLLVGFVERDPINEEAIYDAALCIDAKGTVIGTYRKVHLFPEAEAHFSQGNVIHPIKFENVSIGVMICADMRSPEMARALTVQGAQVLIGLTHWRQDNRTDRERLLPARAVENFLPVIDVNAMSAIAEASEPYGNTLVFDERGNEVLRLNDSSQDIAVGLASLTLYPSNRHSQYGEEHFQRRKELYAPLLAENISGISVESPSAIEETEAPLKPKYIQYLREHDDHFRQTLALAMGTFPNVSSGYIGLVDDIGNLQIRQWVGPPGAFIMLRYNEGIAGYVLRSNKVYRWRGDAKNPDDPYFIPSDTEVRSELVAPIRVGNGVAGVILLDSHDEHCFDEDDAEAKLLAHAEHLGVTLSYAPDRPKRIGQPQHPKEVEEVLNIASGLLKNDPFDDTNNNAAQTMAKRILGKAMEITGAMRGNIALVDGNILKIVARQGDASDQFKDIDLNAIKTGIKGWVIRNKKAFYAPNVKGNQEKGFSAVEHYIQTHASVLSELAVPLIADDGTAIGVINLESDKENAFEVELSDPGNCESITGGRHYLLFSALALIGARVVAISKQYEKFKQNEEQAKNVADEHGQRFQQTLTAMGHVAQLGQTGFIATAFSKRVADELSKMLKDPAMRPSVEPIYGEEFLQRCIPLKLAQPIVLKTELPAGGYWRACSALQELAAIELINHAQQRLLDSGLAEPIIQLTLNLACDPIKLTVAHNGTESEQTIAAFNQTPIVQQQLTESLAIAVCIASWHKCELVMESDDGGYAYHLLIPRFESKERYDKRT